MSQFNKKFTYGLMSTFPILLMFLVVFTGFDLNFKFLKINFSINFIYIIIFFWILRNPDNIGFGLIFFAGIINDVVQNFPIGISSINFLLICVIASFIRSRTLLPNLLYDWVLFLITLLIISSINYLILSLVFDSFIKYSAIMSNSFITFLIYPIFAKIFKGIDQLSVRGQNVD